MFTRKQNDKETISNMDRIESYFDPLFDYSNTKIDVNDKPKKQKIYYRQMSAGLRVGDLDNIPNLIY